MQCTPQAWESYVQMQVEILRLLFRFVHHDVVPWDAKIDNVGLAEAREPHSAPVWVFCDLDGLRDTTEYPNVGGYSFSNRFWRPWSTKIASWCSLTKTMRSPMAGKLLMKSRGGWEEQTLILEALVTHEMGTERWTCLGSTWYCIIWLYSYTFHLRLLTVTSHIISSSHLYICTSHLYLAFWWYINHLKS